MNYLVVESFKVKNGHSIEAGKVINITKDKAAILIKAEKIRPELSETGQDSFQERAAIMQHDGGLPQEEAEILSYGCVRPLPLTYAEPCGKQTPPNGYCMAYSMKLYKPSMDLKPFCLKEDRWCWEVSGRE